MLITVVILMFFLKLFLLEDQRDKKIDYYARVIQKAFQKYFNRQKFLRQKEQAAGRIRLLDIFTNII